VKCSEAENNGIISILYPAEGGKRFYVKPKSQTTMKTIAKTLIAFGILFITLQGSVSMGGPPGGPQVAYAVNIVPQTRVNNFNLLLYVGVTDETGRLVAPAQRFKLGTWTYYFYENGPVTGTRVAHLVNDPVVPTNLLFNCAPATLSGKFLPGDTYFFTLYPTVTRIK
jgi:hypothetical protein